MGGKFEGVISIIVLAPLSSCSNNRLPVTDDEDKIVLVVVVVVATATATAAAVQVVVVVVVTA